MSADPVGANLVKAVVDEIAMLHYEGGVRAIGIVFIHPDGNVGTRIAIPEGMTLPLLAGSVLLQTDIVQMMTVVSRDIEG